MAEPNLADRVYAHVRSYEDLLQTNVDFFGGPIDPAFCRNWPSDAIGATILSDLVRLAREKRLFAIEVGAGLVDCAVDEDDNPSTKLGGYLWLLCEPERLRTLFDVADAHDIDCAGYEYANGRSFFRGENPLDVLCAKTADGGVDPDENPWDVSSNVQNAAENARAVADSMTRYPDLAAVLDRLVYVEMWTGSRGSGNVVDALLAEAGA